MQVLKRAGDSGDHSPTWPSVVTEIQNSKNLVKR